MDTTISILQKSLKLRSSGIEPRDPSESSVADRLLRLPGYTSGVMENLHVLLVGAGGLGGEIGHGLVRNGIGCITICDADSVELSNLNRQRFYAEDLYQNKALRLVRNLQREAILPITLIGLATNVEKAIAENNIKDVDAVICGVDNQTARVFTSKWCLDRRIPAIFAAVNNTADFGYVFVQTSRSNDPCFGCAFPNALQGQGRHPCTVGSSIDILKTVAGPVLYSLGALFMKDRPLSWSYKEISLSGMSIDGVREIQKRANCQLCQQQVVRML